MEHVLLVVHVIIAAALIGMVLLQRSDTDGFGMGSGGGTGLLSGRAQANLMTRTTAILAALFIANSLLLSILASNHRPASIVDTIEKQQAVETFKAPVVPNAGEDKAAKKDVAKKANVDAKKDVAPADAKPAIPEAKPAAKAKAKPAKSDDDNGESQSE